MKTSHTIFSIALSVTTIGGTAIASQPDTGKAGDKNNWLIIPAIYNKVTEAGYFDIQEIDRERNGYKVDAFDKDGHKVELFVDPVNGKILDARTKKSKSYKYRDTHSLGKSDRNNNGDKG